MKILVTVGHSILKNGNITSADGTKFGGGNEYRYCKSLGHILTDELEQRGHTVNLLVCPEKVFNASTDEKPYKLKVANSGDYDLLVELHLNAHTTAKAEGTEVYYTSDKGKVFAQNIYKELKKLFKGRGAFDKDNLYILKAKPVAVLVECFFCTNPKEWKKANTAVYKHKIAQAIANGIE